MSLNPNVLAADYQQEISPLPEQIGIFDRLHNFIKDQGARILGRTALVLGLAASSLVATEAVEAVTHTTRPAVAATDAEIINAYPWKDAEHITQEPDGPAKDNITWGYKDKKVCDDKSDKYDCRTRLIGEYNVYDPWGQYLRNCTSVLAWILAEKDGINVSGWGDAGNWDTAAANNHYEVDNTPEVGDIAVWDGTKTNPFGHVGYVLETRKAADGSTEVRLGEGNQKFTGEITTDRWAKANHYIDIDGHPSSTPSTPPPLNLSFVRLNYPGNAQVVSYSETSNYQQATEITTTGYPSVPQDGNVIPIFKPNGDVSFVRLNHSSGHVEVVSYSKASHYKTLTGIDYAGYPSVPGDGAVIPMYQPDGDLSFIRLNHSSGHVEVVGYSKESGFQTMNEYRLASYPAVTPDGSVVPRYWLNGDLVFLRLNHYSGNVELASYSTSSGYQTLANYQLLPYPAVAGDGAVVPMFQINDGDLSFVRLNYPNNVEVVNYAVGTGFQQMNDRDISSYPAVQPNTGVVVSYSN